MSVHPFDPALIARIGAVMLPPGCSMLQSMDVEYLDRTQRLMARDLSNGALAKEEYTPVAKFTGVFRGMRAAPVLARPFGHLSGFHLQYMIPHFSFAGIAGMLQDGAVSGSDPQKASVERIIQLAQEGFLTAREVREYDNALLPITDDSTVYGTAWLLDPIKAHPTLPTSAYVRYTFGTSLDQQPQVAHCKYSLVLGPFVKS